MRVLLAAITCEKGDIAGNLATHLATLDDARLTRCELAVFPEFSLTGSVDPTRHPEHAVDVADDAVRTVVAATRTTGVTAIFGIAERAGDAFFITQLTAHDGEVVAHHRKRHLGSDEVGFAVGDTSPVAEIGGRTVGTIICAESHVDFTWDATVAAGAEVIAFCSAPGLDERRTTEAEWRDGFDWWASAGLADARRNAQRLGVWVAMATQAGSTVDEDFPGIAALVSPAGDVVAQLPDRHPGTLVVEFPHATL